MSTKKRRPDAKIYQELSDEQQDQLYAWLKEDTYENVRARLKKDFKFSISLGPLHDFYKERFAKEREDAVMKSSAAALIIEQEAAKDFSPALAKFFGQKAFECGIEGRKEDAEDYLKMARSIQSDLFKGERFKLELQKFRESLKSAQEKALDALFADIQGNEEAEQLFYQMRDALNRATEEAANV